MPNRPILKNKFYLYLTEFFSGMAVMAVELGASRLLAPYFSSSQIVWTIIIGTIMIAMALGNIWGGRRADRDPDPDRLYRRLIIAAVWIAAIPVLGKYLILLISGVLIVTISTNLLIWAAFLACMVIFVFPLFLLGTVTPSLVKYTVDNLDNNGKTVGMMGAANTVGSILGTFLPTFVTIPAVGTAVTFLIFSGILLLLSLVYFLSARCRRAWCAVGVILFLVCSILGSSNSFAFWDPDLVREDESIYNYLQVKETDESVILSTNVLFGVQSIKMKNDTLTGMYYDYAMAASVMAHVTEKPQADLLVLGMGTGTYATQCRTYFDNLTVEGVEIDQKIVDLASEYFDLSDEVQVTTYDGRAYLNAIDQKYDVIMVDAYQDITIPFQMSSVEFFTLVREHLTDDGVMVVNMNMHTDEAGNINQYLCDTISAVFDYVWTVDVPGTTNRELFASAAPVDLSTLRAEIQSLEDPALRSLLSTVTADMVPYTAGDLLLTDDCAPVELLGMRAIDALIQDELGYYKNIFEQDGISGILDMVG
jgi:spermidine synthase